MTQKRILSLVQKYLAKCGLVEPVRAVLEDRHQADDLGYWMCRQVGHKPTPDAISRMVDLVSRVAPPRPAAVQVNVAVYVVPGGLF